MALHDVQSYHDIAAANNEYLQYIAFFYWDKWYFGARPAGIDTLVPSQQWCPGDVHVVNESSRIGY